MKTLFRITIGIFFILVIITLSVGLGNSSKSPLCVITSCIVFLEIIPLLPLILYRVLCLATNIKCSFNEFYLIQSILLCVLLWCVEYAFGAFDPSYLREDDAASIVFPLLYTACIILYIGINHWEKKIKA